MLWKVLEHIWLLEKEKLQRIVKILQIYRGSFVKNKEVVINFRYK